MIKAKKAVILISCAAMLAACGKGGGDKAKSSQVAVKVNGDEISVHQINGVLAKMPDVPSEQAVVLRKQVLEKLIDQQLSVQQALDKKLDRSPEVVSALENARREILAKAYAEQIASALPKPTKEEAKTYFAEHPELFSQRRVFSLQEMVLPAKAVPVEQLQESVNSKPLEEVAAGLKAKNIPFRGGAVTRPAEQIPLEILPKLQALKPGQAVVNEGPQLTTVIRVVGAQSAPVGEEAAIPQIMQFLGNQRAGQAISRDMAQVREKAKIEYVGDFAQSGADVKPATPAPAAAAAAAKPQGSTPDLVKGAAALK